MPILLISPLLRLVMLPALISRLAACNFPPPLDGHSVEVFSGSSFIAPDQFGQWIAHVDLVLQTRTEQIVGAGGAAVGGNGTLAHTAASKCKKAAVNVAKSGISSTPD